MAKLRAQVVATAFVTQMMEEAKNLRSAKERLESALAAGQDLKEARERLDDANTKYRAASVQIRKHTVGPKPKAKAKAKAAAQNGAA